MITNEHAVDTLPVDTDMKRPTCIRLIHFSGVTNKIHHCLRFPCGSRYLVRSLVSHTSVIFVYDIKLVCDTNTNTSVCDTNAETRWRLPHEKRKH